VTAPGTPDTAGPAEVLGAGEAGASAEAEGPPEQVTALAATVAALDELADLPVTEHVPRYDALHGELSDALAAIDGV
jgi:hypothetical protein